MPGNEPAERAVGGHLRLYSGLAPWFHLLTHPDDYAEEAGVYSALLEAEAAIPVRDVLELGSGGGNNASHMKRRFALTLTDLSPHMLAISRDLNPECEHLEGDMRTLRLGRLFDAVFVHDAVAYITTLDDLRAVAETARAHLRPGGVALFVPDDIRENFRPGTDHGGHDASDGRGVRYVEWSFDPDPGDTTAETHMAYLLREASGEVHVHHELHLNGVFSRQQWVEALAGAGLEPRAVPIELSDVPPGEMEAFVGRLPPVNQP
jgi:SAM-dependent methyltransferase